MAKKLMPKNKSKTTSAGKLSKAGGTNQPMTGAGARATGKPKLRPMNGTEQTWDAGSLSKAGGSSKGMDGVRS